MFNLTLTRKPSLDKWKKHPDIVALGNAFSKAFIAASSKSIKTLSGAAFGRSDNRISRKRLCAFCFVWQKSVHARWRKLTSSNADATETAGVETSLNSLIFLETFLAPIFPKQISWLWFPRIEISCSPLVIAEVRQLSVWYWAQFQAVVNLFSLFL